MRYESSNQEQIERVLVAGGARLRSSVTLTEVEIDRLLESVLDPARRTKWTSSEAQFLLQQLLQPFCGPGMARAAVDLAVRRSTSAEDPRLAPHNWPVFLSNLTESVGEVCGLAAAGLVVCAGRCLTLEM